LLRRFLRFDTEYSQRLCIAENSGALHTTAGIIAHSGDSWVWFLVLGLVWFFGSPDWKALALTLLISILAVAAIVTLIKFSVRRQRPEGTWGTFYRRTDPHSFPSGHSARAALIALMAISLGPLWLGILLLVWAPLVILARVAMGLHYLSDVIAGALVGLLVAVVVLLFVG
jgi:membrane-associated phospholipid phosphatase